MAVLFITPCRPPGSGERLLLASILRRAAYDIALYRNARKLKLQRLGRGAYDWMFDNRPVQSLPPDDRFTSFLNICTLLDQDPNEIRRKTLKLTRKDVRKFDMVN